MSDAAGLIAAEAEANERFSSAPAGGPQPCPLAKHWIEFVLVEHGRIVTGEACVAVLGDGSKRSGATNSRGAFRVENLLANAVCRLALPRFDSGGGEGVPSAGEGVPYLPGEKQQPLPLDRRHVISLPTWALHAEVEVGEPEPSRAGEQDEREAEEAQGEAAAQWDLDDLSVGD